MWQPECPVLLLTAMRTSTEHEHDTSCSSDNVDARLKYSQLPIGRCQGIEYNGSLHGGNRRQQTSP